MKYTVHMQYSAANMPFPALTFTSSILFTMFTGACGPPEKLKPCFGAALVHSARDCGTRLFSCP